MSARVKWYVVNYGNLVYDILQAGEVGELEDGEYSCADEHPTFTSAKQHVLACLRQDKGEIDGQIKEFKRMKRPPIAKGEA